jgi:hypothetical protein
VAFGRYSVELLRSTESLFGTEVVVENSEIWEVKVIFEVELKVTR